LKRPFLLPFVPFYRAGAQWRNRQYDSGKAPIYKAPIPVISVGNISTGGTGKTPLAEYLLAYFQAKHLRPAYLSRGYGRKTSGYVRVQIAFGNAEKYGDEAFQVARKFPDLPVAVCANRKEGIELLLANDTPDVIILDDAFQHRKVARDLNLVVMDAYRMPDQDALLPAGNLREPLNGLERADMFLVNRLHSAEQIPELQARLAKWDKPVGYMRANWGEIQGLSPAYPDIPSLWKKQVIPFAGIGNPEAFADQVLAEGAEIVSRIFFPDHHFFRPKDMEKLQKLSKQFPEAIFLTTEKDATRLYKQPWMAPFITLPIYFIPLQMEILQGEAHLHMRLDQLFPTGTT